MRSRGYLVCRLVPWLIWMSLICFFSSQSGDQVAAWLNRLVRTMLPTAAPHAGLLRFSLQKLAHFLAYAVLGVLAWRAAHVPRPRLANLLAGLFSVAYAVSDEWHQSFVPGRGPSWRDVGIDSLGVLTGLILLQAFRAYRRRRDTPTGNSGLC